MEERIGKIVKVAGPLVVASDIPNAKMYEMVYVGEKRLFGEIIEVRGNLSSIQVYEDTSGIGPGEPVYSTGMPLSVELGPGLIGSIYDGVQRPLDELMAKYGEFVQRGIFATPLNREKLFHFVPVAKVGEEVSSNDVLGEVQETPIIKHKILVPPNTKGTVIKIIGEGDYNIETVVAVLKDGDKEIELKMYHKWPVRFARPVKTRIPPDEPLVTGQRTIDMFFPIAKGGTACVPGPFGSGKTVVQHQLSKWADADVIVFIGCGERGNEMTDVLIEFPELKDPKSGRPLMERTVLVANTSNMPVAAREASVFTGITIAEYYRDMGYNVALMADSTSRWAEAMREMSGRLEEMPGEEGYPAYLASRISSFYERAGKVYILGKNEAVSSLSVIGAVSPPGGDLSDPVVQATLRTVRVFWSLDASLAYARHFPAIHWLRSYSLYADQLKEFYDKNAGVGWTNYRARALSILRKEAELQEMVRLVGIDALSPHDRLTLEIARSIREDFLQQDAFDPEDTYTSLKKQYRMIRLIFAFAELAEDALKKSVELEQIITLPVRVEISRAKFIPEKNLEKFDELEEKIKQSFESLLSEVEHA
ncbi:V-type ATP synthase subunit A [Caldisericum exile]|uniref:V-type ATP synthase alpha chain n=1 Tax=Caldisericum exile (strain DSM 21853 / NBRC 104410 / AZM16c01) TaxID=511051 RepID=A0A7U6GF96_CALEA|nr:V-type ATP synthase subunit A [Caldisericum exile]BAL81284.1 V-type ATP synthase alpha chain [Caldisericum exile AZM16c01]